MKRRLPSLHTEPPGYVVGEPFLGAMEAAVAVSRRTPTGNLCCTREFQGETPVTDEELQRARRILARQPAPKRPGGGHTLCAVWIDRLAAMSETERGVVRRVISMQSEGGARPIEPRTLVVRP